MKNSVANPQTLLRQCVLQPILDRFRHLKNALGRTGRDIVYASVNDQLKLPPFSINLFKYKREDYPTFLAVGSATDRRLVKQ
jgi:hypothetical protein